MYKIIFPIIVLLVLIFGSLIGYRVYEHNVLYHYKVVTPGVLYRSGILSYHGLSRVHELSHFKSIVDLSADPVTIQDKNSWYQSEAKFSQDNNIHLYNLYLAPGAKPDSAQIQHFLMIISNKNNLPVLVHCSQGVIRTNMMVSVYKISSLKQTNAQVFSELPMFGHTWKRHAVEKQFILSYRPQ